MTRLSKELAAFAVLAIVIYCAATDSMSFWNQDGVGLDWFGVSGERAQPVDGGGFHW
ncbi:hypothetical protein NONI108955_09920 [Nocardia ninae]|uniref:Uncharacterized protein n=1 Tax=Nocardia ninae NBRC 108245 TaxID=1210091 RepID=A0A511M9N1_9NOCA|nr:hypothetical protein [Nocardia ninae]GEM36808.1 hypothetical protein NN4_13270 [Nocardia ninae NBRC 108245]